jgi:hypothetical protein
MRVVKLICQGRYTPACELDVIPDRLDDFATILDHLIPDTSTIKVDFDVREVRHVLGLLPENQCNNSRPRYNTYQVHTFEVYRFNCKYGGKKLEQFESDMIEESEWSPGCITADIFNTAYMYNRCTIVRHVNELLRAGNLCNEYASLRFEDTNLEGIDDDLKLDVLMLEYNSGNGSWVFTTMNKIRKNKCAVELRHLAQLNELLLDARYDKKMVYHHVDVAKFLKFVTDQGFSSKSKIDKEQCMCDDGYHYYDCFGRYHKFYI